MNESVAFVRKPARLEDLITWDKVAKQRSGSSVKEPVNSKRLKLLSS